MWYKVKKGNLAVQKGGFIEVTDEATLKYLTDNDIIEDKGVKDRPEGEVAEVKESKPKVSATDNILK